VSVDIGLFRVNNVTNKV